MMSNWRAVWKDPQLPFCIVQLANYDGRQQTGMPQPITEQPMPVNSNWARLREAQRLVAKEDPHAALAVAIDLGETVDIHPLRKKEVAERVGHCFDHLVFHKDAAVSPQPIRAKVVDGKVVVTFDQPLREGEQATLKWLALTASSLTSRRWHVVIRYRWNHPFPILPRYAMHGKTIPSKPT